MFFEGSEKKAEIIISDNAMSLLTDIDDSFWQEMVDCCNARIISTISNQDCKAFLLSESSLFIWRNKLLILTCGVTTLVNSVEFFLQRVKSNLIKQVIYQRKNEYFAHAQLSSFGDDMKRLSNIISGKTYRFGEMDNHHNYIFHHSSENHQEDKSHTYQFLAYQISTKATELLTSENLSAVNVRDFLMLDKLFPGFKIDDFVFKPYGYSLNAIKGNFYVTIHITPQTMSSYVSFESNINLLNMVPILVAILQPSTFDLLAFNVDYFEQLVQEVIPEKYISTALVSDTLPSGTYVCFATYNKPKTTFTKPVKYDAEIDRHCL